MDHYNQFMQSKSSNVYSKHWNENINMSNWLYWVHNRIKNFNMLGSIWYANLDIMVNNVRYVCDDSYEYKQPSESYKSDKPYESEFGYIQEYNPNGCATCGCSTKPCYCEYPIKLNNNEYNEHKLK